MSADLQARRRAKTLKLMHWRAFRGVFGSKAALQIDSELKTSTTLVETILGSVRLTGQVTSATNFDRVKDVVGRGVKVICFQLVAKQITMAHFVPMPPETAPMREVYCHCTQLRQDR